MKLSGIFKRKKKSADDTSLYLTDGHEARVMWGRISQADDGTSGLRAVLGVLNPAAIIAGLFRRLRIPGVETAVSMGVTVPAWAKSAPPAVQHLLMRLTAATASTSRWTMARNAEDLRNAGRRDRVLLVGDSVMASIRRDIDVPSDAIEQPPRRLSGSGFSMSPPKEALYIWVETQTLLGLKSRGGKVYLGLDQFLHWGRQQGQRLILISGGMGPDNEATALDVWHFDRGILRKHSNRKLPARIDESYADDLRQIIKTELETSGNQSVVVYEALDRSREIGLEVEYLAENFFEYFPKESPIRFGYARLTPFDFVFPVSAITASLVAAFMVLTVDWGRYALSVQQFEKEVAPIRAAYFQSGSQSLDVLTKKREFMVAEPKHRSVLAQAGNLLGAVSEVPDVTLRTLHVRSPGAAPADGSAVLVEPDFSVVVRMPEQPGKSALDQGERLVSVLASSTGAKTQLVKVNNGRYAEGSRSITVRDYEIQGFMTGE